MGDHIKLVIKIIRHETNYTCYEKKN